MIETFLITGACIAWFKVAVQKEEMFHNIWSKVKLFCLNEVKGLFMKDVESRTPQWINKLFNCTRCIMFWWSFLIWIPVALYIGVFPTYQPFVTAAFAKFFYNQITA